MVVDGKASPATACRSHASPLLLSGVDLAAHHTRQSKSHDEDTFVTPFWGMGWWPQGGLNNVLTCAGTSHVRQALRHRAPLVASVLAAPCTCHEV
eukprot:2529635-Amphidinium_carterae.2